MRSLLPCIALGLALLGSCVAPTVPRTVEPRWLARCAGGNTNVYGITREHACMAAAKGYENAGDVSSAAVYYRRACDLGVGDGCVDWARVLHERGNVVGARLVLSTERACDTDEAASPCGWALVRSYEHDAPPRPDDARPVLRRMCDVHRVASACTRLERMGDLRERGAGAAAASAVPSPPQP